MLVASLSLFFFYLCFALIISSFPAVIAMRNELPLLSFEDGYTQIFGDDNLMLVGDGKSVQISLDRRTGAGFASQDLYLYGLFSASIKLPSYYAAGVVVAFYMSNGDVFEKTHDELDFEFLGNIRGREWRVQTNVYGNGSTSTGREERYELWFDPTEDFHHYSILWSSNLIIFCIDDIPIREIPRTKDTGGDFPSKPMSLYATIWDGSSWATSGGRYKVNYRYAPYIAEFTNLILHGCAVDPFEHSSSTCKESDGRLYKNFALSPEKRLSMERFRNQHMVYSYCYDRERYLKPPPECEPNLSGRKKFGGSGSLKFGGHHGRSGKHHRRTPTSTWVRAESQ